MNRRVYYVNNRRTPVALPLVRDPDIYASADDAVLAKNTANRREWDRYASEPPASRPTPFKTYRIDILVTEVE